MNNDEKLTFNAALADEFSARVQFLADEAVKNGVPIQVVVATLMGKSMTLALTVPDANGKRATVDQLRELFETGATVWATLNATTPAGHA